MAPDLRRKVDAARALRIAREAEMKKQVDAQVSQSSIPIARTNLISSLHIPCTFPLLVARTLACSLQKQMTHDLLSDACSVRTPGSPDP